MDEANDAIARVAGRKRDFAEEMRRVIQRNRNNTAEALQAMKDEGEISDSTTVAELLLLLREDDG